MADARPLKVSELTHRIQRQLEDDPFFKNVAVQGEVSNFRPPNTSGHVYFTLKDAFAQVSCAMFSSVARQYLSDLPRHGDELIVVGDLSVYPPQGSYQLKVKAIRRASTEGALHKRFLELKARLQAEGLFDAALKRPLPAMPAAIGVVTSPTGAVIRDILHTLRRRFPHLRVVVAPALVQGEQAAPAIVSALAALNRHPGLELIILARGGGSLEDLWPFNEESVARAIRASALPVITGIGHETDTTIADFAADLRAATPTAAAEMAVPRADALRTELEHAAFHLARGLQHFIETRRQLLDDQEFRMKAHLMRHIDVGRHLLGEHESRLRDAMGRQFDHGRRLLAEAEAQLRNSHQLALQSTRAELALLEAKLQSLDIQDVLLRGFTFSEKDGKPLRSIQGLQPGDIIQTHFPDGKATSTINEIHAHE